ncbi:MAG: carbohydrate kinase family protein [Treponema sp.]|jgi:sugar/nucleoside kinase (ribokinase family)|nr:carbohydrate kinase family protein [Treponema sp.]
MKKVLCAGLMVMDVPLRPVAPAVFEQDHYGIELPVWATGGDATNVAVTLVRLGVEASLCGLVGKDAAGDFVVNRLNELGVDTGAVARHPSLGTGVSYILIEPGGERHFLVSSNINNVFDYSYIPEALIQEADVVYLGSSMCMHGMDHGGSAALFRKAHEAGKLTLTDFGGGDQYASAEILKLLDPMLREADIILPSYLEAVRLTGEKELPRIREKLSGFGIKLLVVKLGAEGCYITDFKNEWRVPTFEEFKAVDATGAGDSFVGGFIRGTLEGWDPETAAVFGSCVASHNVTKVGATGGVPDFQTAYRYVVDHAGGEGRFPRAK